MAIFRQYIAPLLIVIVFVIALVAVGARTFLPNDMAAPAPIEDIQNANIPAAEQSLTPALTPVADLPSGLEALVKGLPLDTVEGVSPSKMSVD
ncbi:MAG: hypothetical protein MUF72_00275 [Elainella sp. Prado103]|jgi:hypothetical protein|nr:hypothetical protein [Elainella sp. Prado103]